MIRIISLPARDGDCFFLLFEGTTRTILVIDSGYAGDIYAYHFFPQLKALLDEAPCDVKMLLTHIDRDHIEGYKELFTDKRFEAYTDRVSAFYYNSFNALHDAAPGLTAKDVGAAETLSRGSLTSFQDGLTLEKVLQEKKIPIQSGLFSGVVFDLETDIRVTVLSPSQASLRRYENWVDKEKRAAGLTSGASTDYTEGLEALAKCPFRADSNPVNASSIGILLETGAHKMLFLGDALPADIANGLKAQGYSKENPCTVDLVKLSHHGSRHNTSPELLGLLHSKVFAISGNGTRGHPDKETLARIVATQEEPVFWFNQDIIHDIFCETELASGIFQAIFREEWVLE